MLIANSLKFLSALSLAFALGSAVADTVTGRVIAITDGDTLVVLDRDNRQHKIRLSGIDAPEKAQNFGQKSKTSLSALVYAQMANADCRKPDRYGRKVCVVSVSGKDVGLEQVAVGMAWWYRKYAKEQTPEERSTYEHAESNAKIHRLGLWADKSPIPPWRWRHGARE